MHDKLNRRRLAQGVCPPLSPQRAALMRRRVELLLGFILLPDMTQEETDWLFRHRQRVAADE